MIHFKQFIPTIWYFSKRFLICLAFMLVFFGYLSLRYMSFLAVAHVVANVFTDFSYEYLIYIIIIAALLMVALIGIGRLIIVFVCIRLVYRFIDKIQGGFRLLSIAGKLGAGKTLLLTYIMLILADISFAEKRFEYLLYYGRQKAENPKPFKNEYEAARFKALKETVEYFYNHPDLIPELCSSYGIWRDGQKSFKLKFEHFLQRYKLPEGVVIAQDESADILSNRRSKASKGSVEDMENEIIAETLSRLRHYYDAYGGFAEQDNMENNISLRRVVNANWFLTKLTLICRPNAFIRRANKIKSKVLRKAPYECYDEFKDNAGEAAFKKACTLKQANKYDKLTAAVKKIGFIKINYEDSPDKERITAAKVETGFVILPCNLGFEYETRNLFFQNRAFDLPLDLEPHESLYVRNSPIE